MCSLESIFDTESAGKMAVTSRFQIVLKISGDFKSRPAIFTICPAAFEISPEDAILPVRFYGSRHRLPHNRSDRLAGKETKRWQRTSRVERE